MRAVCYTRCSTTDQHDSGLGLEAQRRAIVSECERRGWPLVRFEQDVLSGRTTKRPGLIAALDACEAGNAEAIVVSRLDRLTRSVVDLGNLIEQARRGGWNLVAIDFGLDLFTPNGKLVANLLGSIAEWERETIGQRTKDALRVAKADGIRLGRPPAVPDEVRAHARALREQGMTLRGVARALTAEGVATGHGASSWSPEAVRRLLARS